MTTERGPQGPTSYDEYEGAAEALEDGGLAAVPPGTPIDGDGGFGGGDHIIKDISDAFQLRIISLLSTLQYGNLNERDAIVCAASLELADKYFADECNADVARQFANAIEEDNIQRAEQLMPPTALAPIGRIAASVGDGHRNDYILSMWAKDTRIIFRRAIQARQQTGTAIDAAEERKALPEPVDQKEEL